MTQRPGYFTSHQVAQMLGVSLPTVGNWAKAGKLIAHRTPGGHRRIPRAELLRFLREHDFPIPEGLEEPTLTRRVLIVDGGMDFGAILAEYLTINHDYNVKQADDGFTAGWLCSEYQPSIVIIDMDIPGLDLIKIVKLLGEASNQSRSAVIALASAHNPSTETQLIGLGVSAVVRKPAKLHELAALIANASS